MDVLSSLADLSLALSVLYLLFTTSRLERRIRELEDRR